MSGEKTVRLYIFSGLPGTGKTTLAKLLAAHLKAAYLRIDTVEQGLRDLCSVQVEGEGYRLSYRIAQDNLRLGITVIADSCNPIELTRKEWNQVAGDCGAVPINIEVICSSKDEHKKRVESRVSTVPGLDLPDWERVKNREYHSWSEERLVIDTFDKSEGEAFFELLHCLSIK